MMLSGIPTSSPILGAFRHSQSRMPDFFILSALPTDYTIMHLTELFDLDASIAGSRLSKLEYPWEALDTIDAWIEALVEELDDSYRMYKSGIWIGENTEIAPTARVMGPAIIGNNCEIRHNAFLRGRLIIGDNVTIGNASEVKNAILFDQATVPHFNYVGDSILGRGAHLGAGAILSNYKSTGTVIHCDWGGQSVSTARQKLGAMLGDQVEIGCNAVLYPGSIIGPRSIVYPLQGIRGTIPADTIIKADGSRSTREGQDQE